MFLHYQTDDLLDEFTSLIGFFLVPESDESSYDVSNKSSDENEDKESDVSCA